MIIVKYIQMLIESTSVITTQPQSSSSYRLPLILGTIITLSAAILPILFVVIPNRQPTGSLLSPLPQGTITENSPAPTVSTQSAIIALSTDPVASPSAQTDSASNASKKIITFPAKARQFAVTDPMATGTSYIYLTPISDSNNIVYVMSKGEGYFTLGINNPSNSDLVLNYYIINQ